MKPANRHQIQQILELREAKGFFEWCPSKSLIASIRAYQRSGWLGRNIAVLRHRFWSAVTGADIPLNSRIGRGLMMPHPNGIVIHPDAVIGENCLIFQQVTIGTIAMGTGAPPILEAHVDVGAGAKILGAIRIGCDAKIGANAVALRYRSAGAPIPGWG